MKKAVARGKCLKAKTVDCCRRGRRFRSAGEENEQGFHQAKTALMEPLLRVICIVLSPLSRRRSASISRREQPVPCGNRPRA